MSMSAVFGGTDYATAATTKIHLGALTSLIVPEKVRDLSGVIYEVFHGLVEDVVPTTDADGIYYMGCPICKKKACEHGKDPIPIYLANCNIVTFEGRAQARGIGKVLQDMLEIEPSECVPDEDGYSNMLETALDTVRGTPYNMKFILGNPTSGKKNVLELVHVAPTLDLTRGLASFPSSSWRLIDGEITGITPCGIGALEFQNHFAMLHQKPVANLQVLVAINDTGDERGALEKDNSLVRLKRHAVCCLSGAPVVLHRTGDLSSMSKYLRWEKAAVIFMVGRILERVDGVTHLAIKGSTRFTAGNSAEVFNTYFTEYCELTASMSQKEPLAMDNSWTPKRRRQELSDDGGSQAEFTPKTFTATPLKFRTP